MVDGETVPLGPDDVIITQTPRSGWAVAADAGETVALETDDHPASCGGKGWPGR